MKTRFTMIVAVIATFAISLNLHSYHEEVVFGEPAMQMPRGVDLRCADNPDFKDCICTYNGTVCIDLPGECGTGAIGRPGEGSQGGGNYGAPTN